MGRLFFLLLTILLVIAAVVIATFNTEVNSLNLYLESYDLPLSMIILYSFIAGALTTLVFLLGIVFSYKRKARAMKLAMENNREELDNLRRNPLRDGSE